MPCWQQNLHYHHEDLCFRLFIQLIGDHTVQDYFTWVTADHTCTLPGQSPSYGCIGSHHAFCFDVLLPLEDKTGNLTFSDLNVHCEQYNKNVSDLIGLWANKLNYV